MQKNRTLKGIYPDGLKRTIQLFEKAVFEIMTSDEIDRIIKRTKSPKVKKWKKTFGKLGISSWTDCHWIIMVNVMPAEVLRDVVAYMVCMDDVVEEVKE